MTRRNRGSADVLYFGPGYHKAGDISLEGKENQTVYLANGAVVEGTLKVHGCKNLRIAGSGVLFAPQSATQVPLKNRQLFRHDERRNSHQPRRKLDVLVPRPTMISQSRTQRLSAKSATESTLSTRKESRFQTVMCKRRTILFASKACNMPTRKTSKM